MSHIHEHKVVTVSAGTEKLADLLDGWSAEGWEIVSVCPTPMPGSMYDWAVLKRRVIY